MGITHNMGQRVKIALIPSRIYDSRSEYFNDTNFSTLKSYSSLSSILYPESLIFYHVVNNKYHPDPNDIMSNISVMEEELNNTDFITKFEANLPEDIRKITLDKVDNLLVQSFHGYEEKYSMLELMLLFSPLVNMVIKDDTIYIFGGVDEISDQDKVNLKDNKLYEIQHYLDNLKRLLVLMAERIGATNVVETPISKLYAKLIVQQTLSKFKI